MTVEWDAEHLTKLRGRTVIVTGATGGIGRVVSRRLGEAGAQVTLAVRDETRGREMAAKIPNAQVQVLDLADLSSVQRFAREWDGPIDILINNAGIMMTPAGTTADGAELQFGVNHLGHFALTNLLMPMITGRVLTVTSKAHIFGRVDLEDPHWRRRRYRAMGAYAQSKLANLLFVRGLQRRLRASGSRLSLATDPGFADTNLARHSGRPVLDRLMAIGNRVGAQSAEQGALPVLAAAVEDLPPGAWVGPGGGLGMRGQPTLIKWPKSVLNAPLAERLWEVSVAETGVDFPAAAIN